MNVADGRQRPPSIKVHHFRLPVEEVVEPIKYSELDELLVGNPHRHIGIDYASLIAEHQA